MVIPITYDSFDPLEFLSVAESLSVDDVTEADLRTAVSRTYYAVFLMAREKFRVAGKRNIHGRVIGAVRIYDRMAGVQLHKLETLRILADYHLQDLETLDRNWRDNYRKARNFATFILDRLS